MEQDICREAVAKMQRYIAEHLHEKITPEQLGEISMFSPWYAGKIFRKYTGYTPADYIRKLRLKETALKLRDGNEKVIDVAMDAGFVSVDGFQRAFHKEYGCNPKEYALNPKPLALFTAYGVDCEPCGTVHEGFSDQNRKVTVRVIEKPARKVILKRAPSTDNYWSYCKEVGCDVWGILTSIRSISNEPVCMYLSGQYRTPGTGSYVQGVEVEPAYAGSIPEGFEVMELPASRYLLFHGEPFEDVDYERAILEVRDVMEHYNPSSFGFAWDDTQLRIQLEPIGTRGYMEMRAVKALNR